MTEEGRSSSWEDRQDDGAQGSHLTSGDPSHELFGHGWVPPGERRAAADGYTGRHRAADA